MADATAAEPIVVFIMRRTPINRSATLGDMAAQGLDIWCWCNGCYHHAVLETAALINRLGRDQGEAA